jgi:energy-coupling factor transporter ATP-binding protein EcfA2/GNAT superfamily N-acetyltransferase
MKAHVENACDVVSTARVLQMSSLFDVPPAEKSRVAWDVDMPLDDRKWNVGLIVGPSGAGKSSIARALWGERVVREFPWPEDRSILDGFPPSMSIKEIVALVTAVGFGSPPSWMRPYRYLSTGEQFRVTVARALAESTDDVVVVDEFTSTVDRQVAQIASSTIQKALRRGDRQFVAVTCHYDVIDWLQPDWVYQPHTGSFDWRELQQRPRLELVVREADRSAWSLFRQHHYLSAALSTSAKCFVATYHDEPVAFVAHTHTVHPSPKARNIRMSHRTVVLPDYQGLGIGGALTEWLGEYLFAQGYRLHATLAHPALVAHRLRSPRWRLLTAPRRGAQVLSTSKSKSLATRFMSSRVLLTYSFEYQPKPVAEGGQAATITV